MQPLFWSVLKDTACPSPLSVKRSVKNSKSRLFVTLQCSDVLIPRVSRDTPKALPQSGAARVPVFGIRSPQLREPQQPVSESLSQAGRWWVEPRKDAVLPPDCRPVYPVFCGPYTLSAWEVGFSVDSPQAAFKLTAGLLFHLVILNLPVFSSTHYSFRERQVG